MLHKNSLNHTANTVPTVAAMLAVVDADRDLPAQRRADICSGVRSLCAALSLPPESTLALPRLFADRLSKLTPAEAKMSKSRLRNCKSYLDAAFARVGSLQQRKRNNEPMSPAFRALMDRVEVSWHARKLTRLFRFATQRGIAPDEVDETTFDAFHESLKSSTVKDYRTVDRDIRKIWNAMVDSVPGWPQKSVPVPTYVDHYSLANEAFPISFWIDLEAYLTFRRKKADLDLDDLLSEAELLGDSSGAPTAAKPIAESTAKLIRGHVRQFASAIVFQGAKLAQEIRMLSDLVAPETVNAGLKFFIHRSGGERRKSQTYGIATDLAMIAKLWVKSDAAVLALLDKICRKVQPEHDGLPESARRSLAPLRDPENVRSFLRLSDRIVADVEKIKAPNRAHANRIAVALWVSIAQRAPLRIANLVGINLEKNLLRSHAGEGAPTALYFPAEQVKNRKTLEIPLSPATVKILNLYLKKYRKLIIDAPSPWLFPASDGGVKNAQSMSDAMQKLMRDYLGFAINPHSYRHVAARLYLSEHRGQYADVQLLLGHKKLETTMTYYCELNAEETFKHFDAALLKLEEV